MESSKSKLKQDKYSYHQTTSPIYGDILIGVHHFCFAQY